MCDVTSSLRLLLERAHWGARSIEFVVAPHGAAYALTPEPGPVKARRIQDVLANLDYSQVPCTADAWRYLTTYVSVCARGRTSVEMTVHDEEGWDAYVVERLLSS